MKKAIFSDALPKAASPYSPAVSVGSLVFVSGQLGLDPATGALCGGVRAQAGQALDNLKTILEAAGASMAQVVKTTVFVADMKDYAAVNEIYAAYFTGECPARSCVQVAALPMGGLVEIEAIAVKD